MISTQVDSVKIEQGYAGRGRKYMIPCIRLAAVRMLVSLVITSELRFRLVRVKSTGRNGPRSKSQPESL